MFEYNGQLIDADTLQGWADEDGKSVEQYMSTYGISKVDNNSPSSKNTRRNFVFKGNEVDYNTVAQWAAEDNKTVDEYVSAYDLTELGKQTSQTPGAAANVTTAPDGEFNLDDYLSGSASATDKLKAISKKANTLEEGWLADSEVEEVVWDKKPSPTGVVGSVVRPAAANEKSYIKRYEKYKNDAKEIAAKELDKPIEDLTENEWVDVAKNLYIQQQRRKYLEEKQEIIYKQDIGFWSGLRDSFIKGTSIMPTFTESDMRRIQRTFEVEEAKTASSKMLDTTNREYIATASELNKDVDRIEELYNIYKTNGNLSEELSNEFNQLTEKRKAGLEKLDAIRQVADEQFSYVKDFDEAADMASRSYEVMDVVAARVGSASSLIIGGLSKVAAEINPTSILERTLGAEDYEEAKSMLPEFLQPYVNLQELKADTLDQFASTMIDGAQEMSKSVRKRQNITEMNNAGDFADFILDLFSEQAVNTAVTAGLPPVGLALVAASAGGQKMHDMDIEMENGVKISPWQYYGSAVAYMGSEYITEKVGLEQFRGAKKALGSFRVGTALDLNTMTFAKAFSKWGMNMGQEGSAEFFAQLGQNATDRYILQNKNVQLTDGLNEAFLSGAVMSGLGFSAPALVSDITRAALTSAETKYLNNNYKEIVTINSELNRLAKVKNKDQKTKDAIKLYQKRADDIIKDVHTIRKENIQRFEDLTKADKRILLRIHSQNANLKQKIADINSNKELSDDVKKAEIDKLITDYKANERKKEAIIGAATISKDLNRAKRKAIQDIFKNNLGGKVNYIEANDIDEAKSLIKFQVSTNNDLTKEQKTAILEQVEGIGKDGNGKEIVGFNSRFNGTILGENYGMPFILFNKEKSSRDNKSVVSHEVSHGSLLLSLFKGDNDAIALANEAVEYVTKRYKGARKKIKEVEENYDPSKFSQASIAEEKLAGLIDYLRQTDISKDKTFQGKILGLWENIAPDQQKAIKEIQNGEDVWIMLQDYASAFETGEISASTQALMQGDITVRKGLRNLNETPSANKNSLTTRIEDIEWSDNFNAGPAAFIETAGRRFVVRLMRKVAFVNQYEPADKDLIQLAKSLGIDEDSNGVPVAESDKFYELGFEDMEIPGDSITGKLDTSSIKVFGAVVNSVLDLIKNNKDAYEGIIFKGKQDNRFRLYNSMANLIAGKIGGEVVSQNNKVFVNLRPKTKPAVKYSLSKEDNAKLASVHKKGTDNIYRIPAAYKTVQAVASAITKKYFNPIPADARNGVTYDEYEMSAISELALIGREWDPEKQDFGKFLANRGFIRLSNLASKLGIESTVERGGIGITADVETSKEAQKQADTETEIIDDVTEQIIDKQSFAEGLPIDNEVDGKSLKDHLTEALIKASKLGITKYTDEVSKNRTVSPFVASIKDDMAEFGRKIVKKFINDIGYEQFLIDYKNLILDNYTTTYLSKHPLFKAGIQKSINGEWVSPKEIKPGVYDFVDSNGNKYPRGAFDRETAGVTGKTSGPEIIRRNPDIKKIISTGKFVNYHFQDGDQRKKKKQNPEDALARQIGAELGFDLLKNDLLNNGLISEQINEVADLRGIVLGESGIRDVAKDIDRGNVKYSFNNPANISDELVNKSTDILNIFASFADKNVISRELSKLLGYDVKDTDALYELIVEASMKNGIDITKANSTEAAIKIINSRIFKNISFDESLGIIMKKPRINWSYKGKLSYRAQKLVAHEIDDLVELLKSTKSLEKQVSILHTYVKFNGKALRQKKFLKNNATFKKLILDEAIAKSGSKVEVKLGSISRGKIILINGVRASLPSDFDISNKSTQIAIIENSPDYNQFAEEAAEYFLNKLKRFKEKGNIDEAFAWLSLQGSQSNSVLRLAAKIIAHDPNYANIETVFEHLTPVNTMGNLSATYLMSDKVMSFERLQEAFRNYRVVIMDAKYDKNYKDADLVSTAGVNYSTSEVNWSRMDEAGIPKDYQKTLKLGRYSLSKTDVDNMDRMLSKKSGIISEIGEVLASKLGKKKGKWKFFIPPSADDFMGLMYYMVGKGQQGDADIKFIKEKLVDPFAEGIASLEHYKQQKLQEFKRFKKLVRVDGKIKLEKESPTGFTNEQAVRIYLWTKKGNDVKGITEAERKAVMKYVNDTPALLEYSKHIQNLFAADGGYPDVQDNWLAGTMTIDILEHINEKARAEFLSEWINNTEALLGKFNNKGEISGPIANKMRAAFGNNYMEALSDVVYRMKHGRAREFGKNRLANQFNNWIANSVGAIMFLNRRSALLQQISLVNFINYSDNNPIAFAKALGNREQYSKDWVYLFNSDFLKQRRSGLQIDVNEDEIAKAAEQGGNSVKNILAVILKKGFVFTTFADSFAIASGGATFYRNRINTYVKQGMSVEDAESKAFIEFKELTEESQQSSRPDRVSQQQAGSLGRLILAFANTPMQYSRLTKKAAQDLINRRGDWKQNLGKLLYYGAIQNIIFTGLQQALFSLMFDDEDDEIQDMKKISFAANSMVDGFLRGLGFGGAVASVAKNMVMEAIEQSQGRKDYDEVVWEALKLSPPLGSKISKARSVARTFTWKQEREKVFNKGLSLDNPIFMAAGQTVSALTNLPLDRVVRDVDMISTPLRQETEWWQNLAIAFGYGKYELGLLPKAKKKKSNKDGKRGTTKRGKAKRGVTR
jgi:hypothetical protein